MSKNNKKIFQIILASSIVGCVGLSSVFADELKLRSSIDTTSPEIQLKGGVKIDKNGQKVNLSLRDSDIRQVLRMLADKIGYNIVMHESVKGNVTVDLLNTPVNKAFEYIMTLNQLTYWQDGNTLIVATTENANKLSLNKSIIKPIKIKYLDAAVVAKFLNKNVFSLNKPDTSANPNIVINPNTNEIIIFGNDRDVALAQKMVNYLDIKPESKTFEINYGHPYDIANIICNSVFGVTSDVSSDSSSSSSDSSSSSSSSSSSDSSSSGSSSSDSSSSGSSSSGSSSLTAADFSKEENKLACNASSGLSSSSGSSSSSSSSGSSSPSAALVTSASPVSSSSSSSSTLESLGTKGYQVYYNDSLHRITIYGGTEEQVNQIAEIIKKFDKKQPQAYIEVSIIELSESGSKALSSTWAYQDGRVSIDAGYSSASQGEAWTGTVGTALNKAGKAIDPYNPTSTAVDIVAVPGGILWNGSSGTSKIYGTTYGPDVVPNYAHGIMQAVSALLTQNKGRLLANPRIIATNDQSSTIDITAQYLNYRKTTQSLSASNQPLTTTEYDKKDSGIQITIIPRITPNGYVYLDLNPSYTQPADNLKEGSNIVLTFVNKRALNLKNIRVKDGETLIIGGLIQERETNSQAKIPILADIPVLGMFFKSSTSDKSRSELIIMVTPKIVKDNDSADTL